MPEIVDDVTDGATDNWKGAAIYGFGTGLGRNFMGPIGHGAGALVAGSYQGGSTGDAMVQIGGGEALAMLLSGGNGGSSNARSSGVK